MGTTQASYTLLLFSRGFLLLLFLVWFLGELYDFGWITGDGGV